MTVVNNSMKFGHIALNCLDVRLTERFYSRFFGFSRDRDVTIGDNKLIFISSGDVTFELFEGNVQADVPQTPTGSSDDGFRHLAVRVSDVESILSAIAGEAEITQGPLDLSGYGLSSTVVWLRDPDGRILELYQ